MVTMVAQTGQKAEEVEVMNKKLIGWSWFLAFVLMQFHPEWFVHQTTNFWLSAIAMLIALGYTAD